MKHCVKKFLIALSLLTFIYSAPLSSFASDVNFSGSSSELEVIPGGMPFGVKMYADGLIVVGFEDVEGSEDSKTPALDSGMRERDIIKKVDGNEISGAEEFVSLVNGCGGNPLKLTFLRKNTEMNKTVKPSLGSDGKYHLGMWVRDSTAGIGTVTFIVPETLSFGGLGHGICDAASGELVPLLRGTVADVEISSVERGLCGNPGELKGNFSSGKCGSIISNTENGVFGVYSQMPAKLAEAKPIKIAPREKIHEGEAEIYCTVGNEMGRYKIAISDISCGDKTAKSFSVTVTDDTLIEKTGGIVQGMSGSPIIQDGCLVGAVTHVLISDPTKGYGIFIDKMVSQLPEVVKSR